MIIVVMGVSGCGKTTIGKALAERLSVPFIDADDYHPGNNIAKMRSGVSLTDEDRYPWLQSLSNTLQTEEKKNGGVLACSALKEKYRTILQQGLLGKIVWICLEGKEELLIKRMENRKEHFMPRSLLQSQLQTLEIPKYAHCVSIEKDPLAIVEEIVKLLENN